ncbi:hypothetical protein Q3A66_09885 [Hymenobacter sp. BT770]|uniref:hypothetical protein n=1 Tax=Hymenobacter sp. BT770 TaxID=2886942 RepID=UPI001D0F5693|nr:hypothetical protein [Hymenobacter sp. BT770]MCC3153150.1 hypothetical protein [Hymenobacter sp. BT770]MDO3415376.1 hypothetical protein [Hymenobacter sp. BT770]
MAILDNLTKAAKGFFIEEDETAPAQASAPRTLPAQPAAGTPSAGPAPLVTQAEQRHLDHIASLLVGDGKDFGAYTKMVSSMASSGLTGPLLYQTAFNAFSALTGVNQATLLASAEQLTTKLADDRARVLQRHREKMGEATSKAAPGPLALLQQREAQLQADVASLTQQLTEKSQQLRDIQQQAQAEKQKTQAALASYELANAAAAAELQAHRQAAQNFLNPTATPSNT